MRSTLERDAALWIILASATVTTWTESEIVWIFRRAVSNPSVRAFVQGVTAAATGAIAGAAFVLGKRAVVDVPSAAIALGTLAGIVYVRRLPELLVIVVAGAVGLLAKTWIGEGT